MLWVIVAATIDVGVIVWLAVQVRYLRRALAEHIAERQQLQERYDRLREEVGKVIYRRMRAAANN